MGIILQIILSTIILAVRAPTTPKPVIIVPLHNNSKYVHLLNTPKEYYGYVKEVQEECEKKLLDLPAVNHQEDWKSLQKYLPKMQIRTKDPIKEQFVIALRSNDFHDDKGWVDPKNRGKPSFILWEYNAGQPNQNYENNVVLQPWKVKRRNEPSKENWYLFAADNDAADTAPSVKLRVICELKLSDADFQNTYEEIAYKNWLDKIENAISFPIGETENFRFRISRDILTWDEATNFCAKITEGKFQFWEKTEQDKFSSRNNVGDDRLYAVRGLTSTHFRTLGLHPLAPFWRDKNSYVVFTTEKGDEAKKVKIIDKQFHHTMGPPNHGNNRMYAICYEKQDQKDDKDCDD